MENKKVLLAILDGMGHCENKFGNAVCQANKPNITKLLKMYPHNLIEASGKAVGLPDGQMGNSEVGHLNIGAGRIVYTGLSLINKSIEDGDFYRNKAFVNVINYCKENKRKLHIMGLISHGGVHSSFEHILALLKTCRMNEIVPIVHAFTDGRDVDPKSFINDLQELQKHCTIATVSGRYYAMDRDKRWDRIELAYNNMIGKGQNKFEDLSQYIKSSYDNNITDEFIVPAYNATLDVNKFKISDGDAVIFANFRPDRARQMVHTIFSSRYYDFKPQYPLNNIYMVTMAQYEGIRPNAIAYPPMNLNNTLGSVIEQNNMSQLRIAETEKYAHVTFFFDGGKEIDYKNEKKILVNSPKVATYDLKPEMSANEITEKLLPEIGKYDVIILNFANPDMVGHTGNMSAAIKAVEVVDKQIGKIYEKCMENNTTMFITADHGNAECMVDENNKVVTKHTCNKVTLLVCDKECKILDNGKLSNIAPSILSYMNVKIPKEMDEPSIIVKK